MKKKPRFTENPTHDLAVEGFRIFATEPPERSAYNGKKYIEKRTKSSFRRPDPLPGPHTQAVQEVGFAPDTHTYYCTVFVRDGEHHLSYRPTGAGNKHWEPNLV